MEFDSDRKRMSVLVKDLQDGHFKLYVKGADNVIKERLDKENHYISHQDDYLLETDIFLNEAAKNGLRTLLIAVRVLEASEVDEFIELCEEAEHDINSRAANLSKVYD
jgi:magnesium-transporting ATPase (P-type)